jgi:hypothetical protein
MDGLSLFFPLYKADEAKQQIYARATAEEIDKTREILDYATAKPQFEAWSKQYRDATLGKSSGNLRAMHNPKHIAGKIEELIFDDVAKTVDVVAKIVDPLDWEKVVSGCYTGLSIGGGYLKKWADKATGGTRYTPRIQEISLVDSPCLDSARIIELRKQDGSTEEVLLKGVPRSFSELLPPPSFNTLRKSAPWKHIALGAAGGISGTAIGSELHPKGDATGKAVGGEFGATIGEVIGSRVAGLPGAVVGGLIGGGGGALLGGSAIRRGKKSTHPPKNIAAPRKHNTMKKGIVGSVAGDVVGSAIGGVAGSLGGPVGAFVGKTVGGAVGSAVGDAVTGTGKKAIKTGIKAVSGVKPARIAPLQVTPASKTLKAEPPGLMSKARGFRALNTGRRLPGLHHGSRHPLKFSKPASVLKGGAAARSGRSLSPAPASPGGGGGGFIGKRWDASKHPREHSGAFASKPGEKGGRFLGGGAGAAGGYLLGMKHGAGLAEQAGRKGAVLYHKLRGSHSRTGEAAEMLAGMRGRALGGRYGPLVSAGALGLGGAIAGGAAGAAIDSRMRQRRAKKAGRLDVYHRLNAKTSSKPNSIKQVKASAKRAVRAGRRIQRFADAVAGKGYGMDGDLQKSLSMAAGKMGAAMLRHAGHKMLPKYLGVMGGIAGAKAGYQASRKVGGRLAARMVARNERMGMGVNGPGGAGPGIIRHGERVITSLGSRLTSRQKKVLMGTAIGGTAAGGVGGLVAAHQGGKHVAERTDRKLSRKYGRPRPPGDRPLGKSIGGSVLRGAIGAFGKKPVKAAFSAGRSAMSAASSAGSAMSNAASRAANSPMGVKGMQAVGRGARALAARPHATMAGVAAGSAAAGYAMGRKNEKQDRSGGLRKLGFLSGNALLLGAGAGIGAGVAAGHKFKKAPKHTLTHHAGGALIFSPAGYGGYRLGRAIGQRPDKAAKKQELIDRLQKNIAGRLLRGLKSPVKVTGPGLPGRRTRNMPPQGGLAGEAYRAKQSLGRAGETTRHRAGVAAGWAKANPRRAGALAGAAAGAGYLATRRKPDEAEKQELIGRLQKNILLQDDNTVSQWRQARSNEYGPRPFWQMPKDNMDPKQTTMPGMPEQKYGKNPGILSSVFGKVEGNVYAGLAKRSLQEMGRGDRGQFEEGRKASTFLRVKRPMSGLMSDNTATTAGPAATARSLGSGAGAFLAGPAIGAAIQRATGLGGHPVVHMVTSKAGEAAGSSIGGDIGGLAGAGAQSLTHSIRQGLRARQTRKQIGKLSAAEHAQRVAAAKARWGKEMPHVDMDAHHQAVQAWAAKAMLGRKGKQAHAAQEAEHFWHRVADAHEAYDKMRPHVGDDASIIVKVPHSETETVGALLHNPDKVGAGDFTRFGKPKKKIFLMHPDEVDAWVKKHGKGAAELKEIGAQIAKMPHGINRSLAESMHRQIAAGRGGNIHVTRA